MMSATATINGKPQRKQLADQLDRLDSIIDTLADVLPTTVAEACREGARLAVKDAILEIIANPELRALLAPATTTAFVPTTMPAAPPEPLPPPEPRAPSMWDRLKSRARAAKAAIVGAVVGARNAVVGRCQAVRAAIRAIGNAGGEAMPVRRILVSALGIGLVVGSACLALPETVAAVIGGVGAATTAFCVQVGGWLRRAACRVGLLA